MPKSYPIAVQGLLVLIVAGIGAGLWFAREPVAATVATLWHGGNAGADAGNRRRGSAKDAVPVVTDVVGEGRDMLRFAGVGTARARRHVTLSPAVPGEVTKVHTRAGQRVRKGAPLVELDMRQAQLAIDMARSKLEDARRQLARADQLRQKRVQSLAKVQDAQALADQAEVELKTARVSLTDHTIVAPFGGIVGIASVEAGDRVTPTTELLTLDDRSTLTVEFAVPEVLLPRLEPGLAVDVRTPGFGDRVFKGELTRIDTRVHPERRTVRVRASVDNSEDRLRPGMSFAVDLALTGKSYPLIPDLALQFNQDGNAVWLVNKGKAKRVKVSIVRRKANTVLVDGEISPGDQIIIEGVQRLRPGRAVSVAKPADTSDRPPGNTSARAVRTH